MFELIKHVLYDMNNVGEILIVCDIVVNWFQN